MKKFRIHILITLLAMAVTISCKDDSLVLVPEWETGVHGYAELTEDSPTNFIKGDPSVELEFSMLWNSIDSKNTVTKIDLFVLFNENYIDQDGNPKVAAHGGEDGVLLRSFEGAEVPGNRTPTTFTISQDDVFALYNGATFDYYGTGELPVWGAGQINADRNTADYKFVNGDAFAVRWEFTTDDGRVFEKWGVSVCTEFPNANCAVEWITICAPDIVNPTGTYVIEMDDSYGDGWNNALIRVRIDGVATDYTMDDGSTITHNIVIPPGASTLTFEFIGGDWDSEVTFSIISPSGNTIASGGPSPADGIITLDLCLE